MSDPTPHPEIVFNPEHASIYDNAPPGALMLWKRGTELHPGWEWAEDLAQVDAAVWPDGSAAGWIRRKSEAAAFADGIARYFLAQRAVVHRAIFTNARFACEGIVTVLCEDFGHLDETALASERERLRIPHDATMVNVEWSRDREGVTARVVYGWGLLP